MKALRAEDVRFGYPGAADVLRGVTFDVDVGECAALIGPNGAGKSTLLLLLNGLLRGRGLIEIFGQPVSSYAAPELRRRIGIVFQDPDDQLFMPEVVEDVALGPLNLGMRPDEAMQAAHRALEQAGIAYAAGRAPHRLSFGERRRVALAAVLAMAPKLLVLDEPTAGLDPRGWGEFVDLIEGLPATKLIATHDLALVRAVCGRTMILYDGQVRVSGATEGVLDDHEVMEAHGLTPRRRGCTARV